MEGNFGAWPWSPAGAEGTSPAAAMLLLPALNAMIDIRRHGP